MKAFADLYTALDETNKTNEKVEALTRYFASAPPRDAAWALYFLSGRKIKQLIASRKLHQWALEASGISEWLFSESYDAVGDIAETMALLLPDPPNPGGSDRPLSEWVENVLLPLKDATDDQQRETIFRAWSELNTRQRFVWHKLITGAFRVGVSQLLITRALAEVSGVDGAVIAHRLMGAWEPTPEYYAELIARETGDADISRPYPFFLAYALEEAPETLGAVEEWQAEWKWDGIRSQLIRRQGRTFLWSRGEELITERFPELAAIGDALPDGTVIDGEILPWRFSESPETSVMPFAQLQRRIGRKTLGKKILSEVPVIILAYDLLEWGGEDIRTRPLSERRALLESLLGSLHHERLIASPVVRAESWDELVRLRETSRDRNAEGLMLKRKSSPFRVGRQRGDWWKWKVSPFTVDAVLIYAQRGSGKRASLYTDYTFGVWDTSLNPPELVPFAKAYSGLTDAEIRKVDAWIRRHTLETFGPVRTVTPELVFELAFEGIQRSSRHKSGIAVRFPRILRWRTDKAIVDADSLETIKANLPPE
jgi:DNA ligase 1